MAFWIYCDIFGGRSGAVSESGAIMGQQLNYNNSAPIYKIGEDQCRNESELAISNSPDFSSILHVGEKLFMAVHFESPYPSVMYLAELEQDEEGMLSSRKWEAVDWSKYEGLWIPCAGSVTPWQSHLGSEEYEPDARLLELTLWEEYLEESAGFEYYKVSNYLRSYDVYPCEMTLDSLSLIKPYYYGYPTEVIVAEDGSYTAVKHMSMGRLAIELAYVMPDNKTAYITDDGTNVMLAMFVADVPGDLSSGTLYAGKFTQKSDSNVEGAGEFTVEWINLGSANDEELFAVADSTKFSDIFEYLEPNVTAFPDNGCPEDFTSVNTQNGHECLKLVEGAEKLASRFETRRYSAMLGATTEFSKWEGFTFDPTRGLIYTAMSENRYGMEDNQRKGEDNERYDVGGPNDIRVEYNKCGCVYSMEVNEEYQATSMYALVCGKPIDNDELNACDLDGIANPDNVAYIDGHDGLLIGEDTVGGHQNDIVWYYDLKSKNLTRIFSTPYGSETTSPYWYGNLNGYAYIVTVIQHPYDESDQERIEDPENTGEEGWVGYFGPFPSIAQA